MNTPEILAARIARLSLEDQLMMEKLIGYLEHLPQKLALVDSPSLNDTLDEFVREHAELLRLLAQIEFGSALLVESMSH
jgi:hypothetical protein